MRKGHSTISTTDVLIITALPEELDVFRGFFDLGQPAFFPGTSLTYYFDEHAVHTEDGQCYSVALLCLKAMGNTNAGIATSHALHELKPSYIFMFGIAGGFKSEVGLADVILPDQILYCAPGKVYPDRQETRIDTLRIDPFLLELLHTFSWDTANGRDYQVKIGPFAITEQVIASADAAAEIRQIQPKMIGIEMESYGVGLAVFKSQGDAKFVAVRGVSDHADEQKNDDHRSRALRNAADFLMEFLRSGRLPRNRGIIDGAPRFIAIHHLSRHRRSSIHQAAQTSLTSLQPYDLIEVVIDQTDLFAEGSLLDPAEALNRQQATLSRLDEIMQEFPDSELGYFGLAHIPLMFHLGYEINRSEVQVFGNDYKSAAWFQLPEESNPPSFTTEGLPEHPIRASGDVLVLMSVSYEINSPEPDQVVSEPLARIHVRASVPTEGIIDSMEVLDAFTDAFRDVRKAIIANIPSARRIHLFYAGPPTLAFRCGQQINPNIDPDFLVYNYSRHDQPCYRWALNLRTREIIERK